MADDVTYTATSPAGPPDLTKQVTDEHVTRGHMPVVKLAVSADGDATLATNTAANGLLVDVSRVSGTVTIDSELPAALALADAASNPTAPAVGAFNLGWNGATWDRLRSTVANGLAVDVTRVSGTVTTSGSAVVTNVGTFAVQVTNTPTVDTELPAAAALGDATANPTTPLIGAVNLGWNGATWDRLRSTIANGLAVDVTRVSGTVAVTQSGAWTVTANQGGAWTVAATQSGAWSVSAAAAFPVTDNAGSLTVDAPVGTPVFVRLSDGASAIATLPVSIAATVTTKETRSSTGTSTNFTGTGASQTIMASNANRLGGTIYNDSAVVCYLKLGATASSTSFTVKMVDQSYYEIPANYTGVIDAFWASGSVRVTELT